MAQELCNSPRPAPASGYFEGWYFGHQRGDDTLAFIPGRAETGAFIQVISPEGSRQFDVPELTAECGVIKAGDCLFSKYGCKIDLPGISGQLVYSGLTPIKGDIMGPFKYLPMECRHGVISMTHAVSGGVTIDGALHSFDGGVGYIEKDSGRSFPKTYLWTQCSRFPQPCALMVSVAEIPTPAGSFTGCICAIIYGGREYRLATYNGAHIHAFDAHHVCISQGKLLLELEVKPSDAGHQLRSPMEGKMSCTIRECANARLHVRLWQDKKPVFDLKSRHAMYEFVPRTDGK